MTLNKRDCIVPEWPAPPGVHGLITTRVGGISQGSLASLNLGKSVGDDPEAVEENRRRVTNLIGAAPRWMSQVHGIEVANLDDIRLDVPISADAAVSRRRRSVCTVMMADCLTVLFCDKAGTTVAAAHAGWRGLAAGVLESTIASMKVTPETVLAFMGPAIGPDSFEVGAEVRDRFLADARQTELLAFSDAFVAQAGGGRGANADTATIKWHANLYALAKIRMQRAGMLPSAIFGGGLCTYKESDRFFSYRRSSHLGEPSGRMAAMIWLE